MIAQIGQQNAVESAGTINAPTDYLQARRPASSTRSRSRARSPIRANARARLGGIAQIRRALVDRQQVGCCYQGQEVIALGISMAKGGDIIEMG